jgi:hypothetical protein
MQTPAWDFFYIDPSLPNSFTPLPFTSFLSRFFLSFLPSKPSFYFSSSLTYLIFLTASIAILCPSYSPRLILAPIYFLPSFSLSLIFTLFLPFLSFFLHSFLPLLCGSVAPNTECGVPLLWIVWPLMLSVMCLCYRPVYHLAFRSGRERVAVMPNLHSHDTVFVRHLPARSNVCLLVEIWLVIHFHNGW